jgi:uncharacterized protein
VAEEAGRRRGTRRRRTTRWPSSPQTLGLRAGEWCGFGADGEAPRDQRADDGGSLVFDSDSLDRPLELLGAPLLSLEVKADKPIAFLVARLCDVHPDGKSARSPTAS